MLSDAKDFVACIGFLKLQHFKMDTAKIALKNGQKPTMSRRKWLST